MCAPVTKYCTARLKPRYVLGLIGYFSLLQRFCPEFLLGKLLIDDTSVSILGIHLQGEDALCNESETSLSNCAYGIYGVCSVSEWWSTSGLPLKCRCTFYCSEAAGRWWAGHESLRFFRSLLFSVLTHSDDPHPYILTSSHPHIHTSSHPSRRPRHRPLLVTSYWRCWIGLIFVSSVFNGGSVSFCTYSCQCRRKA